MGSVSGDAEPTLSPLSVGSKKIIAENSPSDTQLHCAHEWKKRNKIKEKAIEYSEMAKKSLAI